MLYTSNTTTTTFFKTINKYVLVSLVLLSSLLAGCDTLSDSERLEALSKSNGATLTKARVEAPGRPESTEDGVIEKDLELMEEGGELDMDDFFGYVRAIETAKSTFGLNYLMNASLATLHHGTNIAYNDSLLNVLADAASAVSRDLVQSSILGYEGVGECDVDFDDQNILDGFPFDAANGFSYPPHWVQACGDGAVKVEPTRYNHYHLSFEDQTVDCLDLNTGLNGRTEDDGSCTPVPDPTIEPRFVYSHAGNELIRVRLQSGAVDLPFTLHSFVNIGNEPVKVRYKKHPAGNWFTWPSMAGKTVWDVSAYATDVYEVQFTNAGTSLSCGLDWFVSNEGGDCSVDPVPFAIDDLSISPN